MEILFFIFSYLCICYSFTIISYTYGWLKFKPFKKNIRQPSVNISIIIAARNEEDNIVNCLNDIISQDYPDNLYEVIVVDDHSEDRTAYLTEEFIKTNNHFAIRLIKLKETSVSKKQAVCEGINNSKGDLIITTDADCRMGKKWLSTIADFYETYKPKMIIAPVSFNDTDSIFKKWQALDFLSLIAAGAGSANIKEPIMCNGANLIYEKIAFMQIGGFNDKYASGDDIFLLLKFKKLFKDDIRFLKNYDAVVFTKAAGTVKDFINQRIRWVSKSKGYKDFHIISTSLIIFMYNLLLFACLLSGLFINVGFLQLFVFFFTIKLIIDFPIMACITIFTKQKKLLYHYIFVQIINILCIPLISIAGNILKYRWKGRVINN